MIGVLPHVVIVGGGFGGLSAARALRNADVRVTLIDRRNHHVFQPLLYQVATATLSPGDIAAPIRWILRRVTNVRVLLADAGRIDVSARRVELTDGAALDYDWLIVATGSSHAYFGHLDWEPDAPGLKTLEDAIAIRRRILIAFERAEREEDPRRQRELLTFVLVGGGPTGVELAGTLAEIARQTLRDEFKSIDTARARIVLVEAGPTILQTFPEKLRSAARRSLQRLGIEVREGTAVTAVDAHGVMAGGDRIDAGTVLWAAGVAASPLVKTLGVPLDRAGRVIVEPDLSIPGHPEVFVVGDASAYLDKGGTSCPAWRRRRCRVRVMPPGRFSDGCAASRPHHSCIAIWGAWRLSGDERRSAISGGSDCPASARGWPGCSCTSPCSSGSGTGWWCSSSGRWRTSRFSAEHG